MNITNNTSFASIADYNNRLEISETAVPERYRDDVIALAKKLRLEDAKNNNTVLTKEEYQQKAIEIIREKTCSQEVFELAGCLKYKHESTNTDATQQKFSDDWYLNYALTQIQIKQFGIVRSELQKCIKPSNTCPNPDWDGFSYEEILQMYNDGVNIPDDVIEWAQGLKEADAAAYANVDPNSIDVGIDGESPDINSLGQRIKQYILKIDETQKNIVKKIEETEEYKKQVEILKAQNDTEASELRKIQEVVSEFKTLNSKKEQTGLTPTERIRFKSLQETLAASSPLSEQISNNVTTIRTFLGYIDSIQNECVYAKAAIQDMTNLTINWTLLIENANADNKNVNANTANDISISGENPVYGVSTSEIVYVVGQYSTICEEILAEAEKFVFSCSDLTAFSDEYLNSLQALGILDNLKGSNPENADGSQNSNSGSSATNNPYMEEKLTKSDYARAIAISTISTVCSAANLLMPSFSSVISMVYTIGAILQAGLMSVATKETNKIKDVQTNSRNKVNNDTKNMDSVNEDATDITNSTEKFVAKQEKLYNTKSKKSEKLMKELLKLFEEREQIQQEDKLKQEQKAEEQARKQEDSAQNLEAQNPAQVNNDSNNGQTEYGEKNSQIQDPAQVNNNQNSEQPKEENNEQNKKEKENPKLKETDKKINNIKKNVGKFSKENDKIITQIKKRTEENDKAMKEDEDTAKVMPNENKALKASSLILYILSKERKLDGKYSKKKGEAGTDVSKQVISRGSSLCSSVFTIATGLWYIFTGVLALAASKLLLTQSSLASDSAERGHQEVSESNNQSTKTDNSIDEVNSETKRESKIISAHEKLAKNLTKEKQKTDKKNDKELAKEDKKEKLEEKQKEKTKEAKGASIPSIAVNPQAKGSAIKLLFNSPSTNESDSDNNKQNLNIKNDVTNSNTTKNKRANSTNQNVGENNGNASDNSIENNNAKNNIINNRLENVNKINNNGKLNNINKANKNDNNAPAPADTKNKGTETKPKSINTAINATVKAFIYQTLLEQGVKNDKADEIIQKMNIKAVVNDIKDKIMQTGDIQGSIEDVATNVVASINIDSKDDKKSSKKYDKKDDLDENSENIDIVNSDTISEDDTNVVSEDDTSVVPEDDTNVVPEDDTNVVSEDNTNVVPEDDTNVVSDTDINKDNDNEIKNFKVRKADSPEKTLINKIDNVTAKAQMLTLPNINVENKDIPKQFIMGNIDTVNSLQSELDELDSNAKKLANNSDNIPNKISKSKNLLASILNKQLDKLNLIPQNDDNTENDVVFDIDEQEFAEIEAFAKNKNNKDVTKLAASAATNADFKDYEDTDNKYKKKLARYNSTSIDDLKQKKKKVTSILSSSNKKSKK